jgi:hypothetical protein
MVPPNDSHPCAKSEAPILPCGQAEAESHALHLACEAVAEGRAGAFGSGLDLIGVANVGLVAGHFIGWVRHALAAELNPALMKPDLPVSLNLSRKTKLVHGRVVHRNSCSALLAQCAFQLRTISLPSWLS